MTSGSDPGPLAPPSYFSISPSDAREAEAPPRALPITRRKVGRSELVAGIIVLLMGLSMGALQVVRFRWGMLGAALFFTVLGIAVVWWAASARRVLRRGTLVPARVFLMDFMPHPSELRFWEEGQPLPGDGQVTLLERRTSLGMIRAEFQSEAGTRNAFVRLEPAELPMPVRFGAQISPAVAVLGGRAAVWIGPAPPRSLDKV